MSSSEPDGHIQIRVEQGDGISKPYKYSFTYERATLYEFQYERSPIKARVDPCYRCYRQVPLGDQVNVGVLFHKQCFRCRICGLPLGLNSFFRNESNGANDKEIYCRSHVGKRPSEIEKGASLPMLEDHMQSDEKCIIELSGRTKPAIKPRATSSPRAYSPTPSNASSITNITPRSTPGATWTTYNQQSLSYSSPSLSLDGTYIRPKPVLQSYEDFENSKVFDAQAILEQRHREEEDRLQRFLLEEREKEMKRLDEAIDNEKERTASELLSNMDQLTLQRNSRNLLDERERIEEYFRKQRDDRFKTIMDKIGAEEKTRTAKMLERHTIEMMHLLADKDREVDKNALYDHTVRSPIIPPESMKSQLYKSPAIFEQIDKRAVELANKDFISITKLVRDLTRDSKCELDKARSLFRWVIAKDLNKNAANDIMNPNSTSALLKGVKSGKETYHQLYKKLCGYAGLHCEIVLGFSKGAGYKPGMRMEGNNYRNSWTAVSIDGSWRFVNCTWAARHVTGHKDNLPQMFHKYDEFYFLTDPEDYIYQHYPDEPSWQLLEIPLPFSEFCNLPVVKSPFFNYGLKFHSNYGACINTDTGMVEIRLIIPKILGFGSLLESVDKGERNIEGRVLLRLLDNEAVFTVSLPRPGSFYFSVYVGDYWQSECLESACSFRINCSELSGPPSPPYPPVPFYGPTPVLENLKIKPSNQVDPVIVCNGDYVEIGFKVNKQSKITHTFQFFEVSDESVTDYDRYVFLKSRNDTEAVYLVRCPKEGFYIFSLYAGDNTLESSTLDCAYRYLVICQEPSPTTIVFPKTYQRWQRCSLHEPISGDLLVGKRYTFRLDVPQAVEVFVVIGDIWHHLRRKIGFTWEGNVPTGSETGTAKVMGRFSVDRDSSLFAHLLDYDIVEDGETEI